MWILNWLGKMRVEMGKKVRKDAVEFLHRQGYVFDEKENFRKQMIYFGARTPEELFIVIGFPTLPPKTKGRYADMVAHQIHEIVEVEEISKKTRIRDLMKIIKEEPEIQEEAHRKAREYEELYLSLYGGYRSVDFVTKVRNLREWMWKWKKLEKE